ncbi:MAG TPA: FAD-dependent oxidoreductase [Steroidobacteraceae bacterium]|nr:FAD-dependent oxidoreductase [Steroidobacteraceae bacterium]
MVGAGVFGAWTAWNFLCRGKRVLLLDAAGPAHPRASSGGESRLTRTAYGADEVYTRMAWESLPEWKWLSETADLPVFHSLGALFFFAGMEPYAADTLEVHRKLSLPIETLDHSELARRFPQFCWDGIEFGLWEPDFGALMARRSVQALVARFVAAGGEYRLAQVAPPRSVLPQSDALDALVVSGGERLRASDYVFACGPWLPKLFPDLLGSRMFVTRQEVFFFAVPPGDARFEPAAMPGWVDFNFGDMFYGFPNLEARGVKVGRDEHGPPMDPDIGDRLPSMETLAAVRAYMARRFPALADSPLNELRICQYENTSGGDFLIDRHSRWQNAWLVGGGSGHGFKHGPAVGRYAAQLVSGEPLTLEPRFSLATKGEKQQRAVH